MDILLFILGLIGLWLGADYIVESAKFIAKRLGVSTLLIGLTVVSIGTSLPEIMVSLFSGIRSAPGVGVGTMIGSCLTQITLVLGIAALVRKIKVSKKAMRIDGTATLGAIAVFGIVCYSDYFISRTEGILMIIAYIGYLIFTARHSHMKKQVEKNVDHVKHGTFIKYILLLIFGMIMLLISSDLVLDEATYFARLWGVSEAFIGVMIVGVATALPELSTALNGLLKKAPGLSIGTLLGSNITDPFFSTGIGALVRGFEVNPVLIFDIFFWFCSTAIALFLIYNRKLSLSKKEGSVLITLYVIFVVFKLYFFV
jgi:cation:H+ antiporter